MEGWMDGRREEPLDLIDKEGEKSGTPLKGGFHLSLSFLDGRRRHGEKLCGSGQTRRADGCTSAVQA